MDIQHRRCRLLQRSFDAHFFALSSFQVHVRVVVTYIVNDIFKSNRQLPVWTSIDHLTKYYIAT